MSIVGMTGDEAVAQAAKLVNPDVCAAYPITPQTIIVERFSDFVNDGEVDTNYVCVESEHSAMSACVGASATGARVFTATASQGLLLMYEILYIAASSRLPIVMAIANRAVSGPINIHGELSDQMLMRDSGWLSFFSENNQEAYDQTILAFRIGEHPDVQLPVAVGLDGFILSHALEGVDVVDRELIAEFLPPRQAKFPLVPEHPITVGLLCLPDFYYELRYQIEEANTQALSVIPRVFNEWGEHTGRNYKAIETYQCEDAEFAFVTMGAFAGNAKTAVDELREQDEKVGAVKIRAYRPWFGDMFYNAIKDIPTIGIVERAHNIGGNQHHQMLASDVFSTLYNKRNFKNVYSHVGGLGGRDMLIPSWKDIYKNCKEWASEERSVGTQWVGLRE
ncbi:MAG: pyruvate ferredoxin oxidoreductase [Candidatus Hodarchaeales archaeon]